MNFKPKILCTSPSLEIRSTPLPTPLGRGTQSTQNYAAERMWPEIIENNQEINYPLQRVLVALQGKEKFDFDDVVT